MDARHIHHLRRLGDAVSEDTHEPIELTSDEVEAEVTAALATVRVPPRDVLAVVKEETTLLLTLPTRHETKEQVLRAYRTNAPARVRRIVRMRILQRTGVTHQRRYLRDEAPSVDEVSYTRLPAKLLRGRRQG